MLYSKSFETLLLFFIYLFIYFCAFWSLTAEMETPGEINWLFQIILNSWTSYSLGTQGEIFSMHVKICFLCTVYFSLWDSVCSYSAPLQCDSIEKFSIRKKYIFYFSYLLMYDRKKKRKWKKHYEIYQLTFTKRKKKSCLINAFWCASLPCQLKKNTIA